MLDLRPLWHAWCEFVLSLCADCRDDVPAPREVTYTWINVPRVCVPCRR